MKRVKNTDMNGECSCEKSSSGNCCRRNGLSICLTISLLISIGMLSLFFYLDIFKLYTEIQPCTSIECIESAAEINKFINTSIDPCEDFHKFVCDKFMKTAYQNEIYEPMEDLGNKILKELEAFIVEPRSDEDWEPVENQKLYYQACLNLDEIDENKDRRFYDLLGELAVWPLYKEKIWKPEHFDWITVMIRANEMGFSSNWLLKVDVEKYDDNNILKISKSQVCEAYDGYSLPNTYRPMVAKIVANFTGYHMLELVDQINEVAAFEEKLLRICEKVENNTEKPQDFTFRKGWNGINKLIKEFTGSKYNSKVAYDFDYIFILRDLMDTSSKEVQANYIMWKIIESFAPFLSEPIRETYNTYKEEQTEEEIDRAEFCLEDTRSRFRLVSEYALMRQYRNPDVIEDQQEFLKSIKEELIAQIEDSEWLDNRTKEIYSEQYKKMEEVIGVPEIFDDDIFAKYSHMRTLSFRSNLIIDMVIDLSKINFDFKTRKIVQSSASIRFGEEHIRAMMDVSLEEHQIYVQQRMLQSFFYDENHPRYLNFGGFGVRIAAELVKSFDDYLGDLIKNQNEKCLVESVQKLNRQLNASLMVSMNYPYLLAQNIAYKAYQNWIENNREEAPLLYWDFTPNQLFWIKSNMGLCFRHLSDEESTPEMEEIGKYRIIENVRHSPFFGDDFNCPIGSPMNPSEKCPIF